MEVSPEGTRLINGIEIIYGKRSASDMVDWVCNGPEGCGKLNKAIRLLIFDVAPLSCGGRGCNEKNPNDFCLCLANVRINDVPIIDKIKRMKPDDDQCVTYSVCHLMEIMNRIIVAISSSEPDLEKANCILRPDVLHVPYGEQFPRSRFGGHKAVHMLQKFSMGLGVPVKYKNADRQLVEHYFRGSEIRAIHSDDFEEVCRQIADGNTMLAAFHAGPTYASLKYCQFYTSVPRAQVLQHRFPGHMLLLIGAVSENQKRAYIALDVYGEAFCKQVGTDEGWKSLMGLGKKIGGYFKISEHSGFSHNFLKMSRQNDFDVPPKLYDAEFEGRAVKIDLVLDHEDESCQKKDNEDEGAERLRRENLYRIFHGKYLTGEYVV